MPPDFATAKIQHAQHKIQFFWPSNIAPRNFSTLKMSIQPFIYGHSGSFFTRKKNEIGM